MTASLSTPRPARHARERAVLITLAAAASCLSAVWPGIWPSWSRRLTRRIAGIGVRMTPAVGRAAFSWPARLVSGRVTGFTRLGHAPPVESEPEYRRDTRREQIGERLAAIRTRIGELRYAQQESGHPVASRPNLSSPAAPRKARTGRPCHLPRSQRSVTATWVRFWVKRQGVWGASPAGPLAAVAGCSGRSSGGLSGWVRAWSVWRRAR